MLQRPIPVLLQLAAVTLSGCKAIDGDYYPACKGFEGDHVRLAGDRFTWDRYTDQVKLGPDRQPIDPFPDYPRTGTLAASGASLQLTFADDGSVRNLHVVEQGGRTWLLTEAQRAAFDSTGAIDACALVREDD